MKTLIEIPIAKIRFIALFCFAFVLLTSCRKNDLAEVGPAQDQPSGGPKKNVIMGTIYDAHGKKFNTPNATVQIHIYANGNIGETDPNFNARMDANSHYEIQVPNNVYAVNGWAEMMLNGNKVMIDLKPLDGK